MQDFHLAQGGIPHWGKMSNRAALNPEAVLSKYTKLDVWKREMRKFNPKGNIQQRVHVDRFRLTT
ncbi:MAG: hypothetical protein U0176_03570 [Bacteroidia bacterium]